MGKIGLQESDGKSQLVLEICSMSNTHIACSHRHHFNNPVKSHFIDWYRVLGVAEDTGLQLIKKRYHKLALQLHPDKNKHPKAEIAFKIVSEAYTCLSDNVKRKSFNSQRWKYFCIECNKIPYTSNHLQYSSKPKVEKFRNYSRSNRVVKGLKDIRERFKEEVRVIENCLRINSLSKREYPLFNPSNNLCENETKHKSQRETPVFEPSHYVFQGYPHLRSQIYKNPDNLWNLQRKSVQGRGTYESPIFENASATSIYRGMVKSRSVCIHS